MKPGQTKIPLQRKAAAVALISIVGTQERAAVAIGIGSATMSRSMRDPEILAESEKIKKRLGLKAFCHAELYLDRMAENAPTANTRDAAGAFQILVQNGLLLRGEPNQIVATADTDSQARAREMFTNYFQLLGDEQLARDRMHAKVPELAKLLLPTSSEPG